MNVSDVANTWIDVEVLSSRCVLYYQFALLFLLVAMGFGMAYALWQWLLLMVVALVIWLALKFLYPKTLKNLVIDKDLQVHCLVATNLGEQIWQGYLMQCQCTRHYVVFVVDTHEPMRQRVRFCIFYDQVTPDDFRKMRVLVRFAQ